MPKVLVVEDDETLLNHLATNLRSEGFNVTTATDGEVGLEKIRSEISDLIILDIMLKKLDGLTICRMVRHDNTISHIPIIMITGHTDGEILFKASKANAFIQKPFTISGLMKKITEGFTQANA